MIKAGTLRGYFVNIKNQILKGMNPFPLSFESSFVRERARELEEIKREREKKKIEVVVRRSNLGHRFRCKVFDFIFLSCN